MKEQIKQLRIEIDGLAQLCEGLKPITLYEIKQVEVPTAVTGNISYLTQTQIVEKEYNTEEIKEAIKSLKLSKVWLGKVLEGLGSENPYGSGHKTVEDIIPETDKISLVDKMRPYSNYVNNFKYKSHIEKVDWLRVRIQEVIMAITPLLRIPFGNTIDYQTIILQNLQEARIYLGFEVGRIMSLKSKV